MTFGFCSGMGSVWVLAHFLLSGSVWFLAQPGFWFGLFLQGLGSFPSLNYRVSVKFTLLGLCVLLLSLSVRPGLLGEFLAECCSDTFYGLDVLAD